MKARCTPAWTVPLFLILAISTNSRGQLNSPAPTPSAPIVQEDFYQPVQEVWNGPVTETIESRQNRSSSQSDFIPQGAPTTAPLNEAPIYSFPTATSSNPPGEPAGGGMLQTFPPTTGNETIYLPQTQTIQPQSSPSYVQQPAVAQPVTTGNSGVVTDYLDGPPTVGRRIFFRYDALYGVLSKPDSLPIGSASAAGIFPSNGIPFPFFNTLSTNIFGSPTEIGNRFEFGEMGEDGGWAFSIFDWDQSNSANADGAGLQFDDPLGILLGYQDADGDNMDDDVDGDHVFGRDGVDLGTPDPAMPGSYLPVYDGIVDGTAPDDTDDLVTWVPVFGSLAVTQRTDITAVGVTHAWQNFTGQGRFGFDRRFIGGVRFIDFNDQMDIVASGSFLDATSISSEIENSIIGPEIGSEFSRRFGAWQLGGTLRMLFGVNFQRGTQSGSFATQSATITDRTNLPLNLSPGAASNIDEDVSFSPVFEWRLGAGYDVGQHARARIGYTGILFGGISRAANSVDYSLPSFGLSLSDDAVVFNALTFGFDVAF